MSRYGMGDLVYAAQDLFNEPVEETGESAIPGVEVGALLAAAGTRGVVVNVSSSVTLQPLPLLSVYTASKAAVNAFTESVALELAPFGVRMHLVLPDLEPATAFGANARGRMASGPHPAYAAFQAVVFAAVRETGTPITEVADVTEAVWRAVTDPRAPMRLPAGADAVALAAAPSA